jgi:hypothetical protein
MTGHRLRGQPLLLVALLLELACDRHRRPCRVQSISSASFSNFSGARLAALATAAFFSLEVPANAPSLFRDLTLVETFPECFARSSAACLRCRSWVAAFSTGSSRRRTA